MDTIPITRVSMGDEELAAVKQVLESGWLAQGKQVAMFEERIAQLAACDHGVATTSCTTALHLALAALGVGEGDEVIVPGFTWVSTANTVVFCGATPVFCDIDQDTYNLDTSLLEGLISPRTVGVIPVHLFGLCADMGAIQKIADIHNIWVLEDAACGLGATYGYKPAGSLGDAACFSFHPRKSVTMGEGGAVTTSDADLNQRLCVLRNHGADPQAPRQAGQIMPEFTDIGFNYRLTDLQAAVGVVQLGRFPGFLAERRRLASLYRQQLSSCEWLHLPEDGGDGWEHAYQSYVIGIRGDNMTLASITALRSQRNTLMELLEKEGIVTRPGTHAPVSLACHIEKWKLSPENFPQSLIAQATTIALPFYPGMGDHVIDRVSEVLLRSWNNLRETI